LTIVRAALPQLELARQAVREVHGRTSLGQSALEEFLSDPAHYLLLAVENSRPIGSLNGYALKKPHRSEPEFFLYEIDVRPECRNRGIGKRLVNRFVVEARSAGASDVWVLTNQSNGPAMAMYERCGLRRLNRDDACWQMTLH